MQSPSRLVPAMIGLMLFTAVMAEGADRSEEEFRTAAAIRELVRRGAVVKQFTVLESETAGLLVRLKAEHLDRKGIIDTDILTALHSLRELSLELRGLPLSDAGLKSLLANGSLVGLDVSGSEISDCGLQELPKRIPRLRLLDVSFTRVGDQGLKTLPELLELRHLSLIGSRVTDGGIDALTRMSCLREVYLSKTEVSPHAAEKLRVRLPKCRIER